MDPLSATLSPPVDPARDHVRGGTEARVTLVEYGDFQCPYCGDAYPVVQGLRETFGDRLRFVFRHMPLADLHPAAPAAAEASEAAGAQGRFWEMHDGSSSTSSSSARRSSTATPRSSASIWTDLTQNSATACTRPGSKRTTGAGRAAASRARPASS